MLTILEIIGFLIIIALPGMMIEWGIPPKLAIIIWTGLLLMPLIAALIPRKKG